MRRPLELRTSGGRVLIGSFAMIPAARRGMQSPLATLSRIFQDRGAVAQLRLAWSGIGIGGGHHHQLTAGDMRDILERAVALHRVMLLWIPSVSHHAISVTIPPQRPSPPPLPGAPGRPEVKPPLVPVGTLAIPAKVERALVKSFDHIARDGRKGFREFVAAIDALRKDPVAMTKIVAFCALLAVPVVGEAAAGAFLAYAYYLLGFHGTLAALRFGAACVHAATATTDAELDAASRAFADAFEDLGEAVIAWLMTRIQPMSSVGARSAAAEKEAATVARAETQAAKVVKTGEDYQTQVLSKYNEAKNRAKVLADQVKNVEKTTDFMVGRLGGKLYDPEKLKQLEAYLERRGITLQVGDEFLPEGMAGGFDAVGKKLALKDNPTEYEVWHELNHYLQFKKLGLEEYMAQTRVQKEQYVFDALENSAKRWDALAFEQQQHAIAYINRVGGVR